MFAERLAKNVGVAAVRDQVFLRGCKQLCKIPLCKEKGNSGKGSGTSANHSANSFNLGWQTKGDVFMIEINIF
jgi:hypothetical protein